MTTQAALKQPDIGAPPPPPSPQVALNRALLAARKDIKPLIKNAWNPHFKSNYADLDACYTAIDAALMNNGLLSEQWSEERNGHTVLCTRVRHVETDATTPTCELRLRPSKEDMPSVTAAITYARRSGVMTVLQLAPQDDDGSGQVISSTENKPMSAAQKKQISVLLTQVGLTEPDARSNEIRHIVGKASQDLTFDEADTVIKNLGKRAFAAKQGSSKK